MDNTTKNRNGELAVVTQRSDRLFTQHNYWYFRTREGIDIGPFDSINKAIDGVDAFIDFVSEAEPEIIDRISKYARQVN